jgi:hypothetical protein
VEDDPKSVVIRAAKERLVGHVEGVKPLSEREMRDCLLVLGFTPEDLDTLPTGSIRCPYTKEPLW